MAILPWATTTRRWRASVSGKRDIGSSSYEGVHITSGDSRFFFFWERRTAALPGWVLIDWPCSALYVVDLVRFRQMAAGVRESHPLILCHERYISPCRISCVVIINNFRPTPIRLLTSIKVRWSHSLENVNSMTLTICYRPAEQPARTRSYRECLRTLDCCRGRLLVHVKFSLHEDWLWVGLYHMFLLRRCYTLFLVRNVV